MKIITKRIGTYAASSILVFSPLASNAAIYDAICDDMDCQIDVTARGVGGPAGFIPADYISSWSSGKTSDYHAGKGVAGGLGGATGGAIAGALLLGPIGLLGGLIGGAVAGSKAGKEFEGYFTIIGYNKDGEKISHSFYFINHKPAKRLRSQLPGVTGLAYGEQRTLAELEASFAGEGEGESTLNDSNLPSKLGEKGSSRITKKEKCWSEYLSSNPAMNTWADANPGLAEKQRLKSGYLLCDKESAEEKTQD